MLKKFGLVGVLGLVICAVSGQAFAENKIVEVLKEGRPYIEMRYRYEFVDQDAKLNDAHASTLRTVLGYETGTYAGFQGLIEGENISEIGNDLYNNTINGRTDRPVVADVETTQINQLFLKYSGIPKTSVKAGRQKIVLDNQRFVGAVGWRQNDQTYDAATLINQYFPDTDVRFGYIGNVQRIFGDESPVGSFDSNSYYYNLSNTSTPIGKFVTYGYILDFRNDSPGSSSQTYGIRLTGKKAINDALMFKYLGEYATQADHAKNTMDYNANYYHIAPALAWKGLTTTLGLEVLGSDSGAAGFSTPLATLHKFNGWADIFLSTPAAGLQDFYVDLTYKVAGLEDGLSFFNGLLAKVQYHDFTADEGSTRYGHEWGLYLKQPIKKHFFVEYKLANYKSKNFGTDTLKSIVGLGLKF